MAAKPTKSIALVHSNLCANNNICMSEYIHFDQMCEIDIGLGIKAHSYITFLACHSYIYAYSHGSYFNIFIHSCMPRNMCNMVIATENFWPTKNENSSQFFFLNILCITFTKNVNCNQIWREYKIKLNLNGIVINVKIFFNTQQIW